MKVTITGPVVHRCPFVDELDVGSFTLTYETAGADVIELHDLNTYLSSFRDRKVTHEAMTAEIADKYPAAAIETRWTTAGLGVACSAS